MGYRVSYQVFAFASCLTMGATVGIGWPEHASAPQFKNRLGVLPSMVAVHGHLAELRAIPLDDVSELDSFLPRVDDITFAMAYLLSEDELAATLYALSPAGPSSADALVLAAFWGTYGNERIPRRLSGGV